MLNLRVAHKKVKPPLRTALLSTTQPTTNQTLNNGFLAIWNLLNMILNYKTKIWCSL